MSREWGWWSEHKLDILSDYLPAFTRAASRKAQGTTVYLDLFAGQLDNRSRATQAPIESSPIRALRVDPPLSTVVLFERPANAAALNRRLMADFPGRDIRVVPGDCNAQLPHALAGLHDLRWAPTFAFIDQQAAEVRWSTLELLAHHKQRSPYKVELWLLVSPGQIARPLVQPHLDHEFAHRVDAMLGDTRWRLALEARRGARIGPAVFREELTNWMRWRLEHVLGYANTHVFELRNTFGRPVYSMVFATDNAAGNTIMSDLYWKAAERHPRMREEALAAWRAKREAERPQGTLFDPPPSLPTIDPDELYRPDPPHVPFGLAGSAPN
jgi:three-Cys-motif partner protein